MESSYERIGTSVAAGVAQAGLQSRQVSAQRDNRRNDAARQADRARDIDETILSKVLEERDESETSASLRVEDQTGSARGIPGEPPPTRPLSTQSHVEAADEQAIALSGPPKPESAGEQPLYRHLDLKA